MSDYYQSCDCHEHRDHGYSHHKKTETTSCDCCITGLAKVIHTRFSCGDVIGITFFQEEGAGIFIGRFRGLKHEVLEIEDLLVPGTTSFVPLCSVGSVEKGLVFQNEPLNVKS
ncbi:hypothetical protein ACFFGV_13315 [Pontibacillus salicampi]|uniref:DUF2642 domain-containing protein n=1 Tax=Pontibacillus salicampi TaxID=1449801 RepID=A0ABV6LQK8_9BACI